MSTKIYNAYEYFGKFSDLIDFLYWMKRDAVARYTLELSREYEGKDIDIIEFEKELEHRFRSGFLPDGSLSVVVIPWESRLFIIVFGCQCRWLCEIFDSREEFKDFHYQNQTDPPDVDNWEERESVWEGISEKRPYRFTDMGPSYELVGTGDIHTLWNCFRALGRQKEYDKREIDQEI